MAHMLDIQTTRSDRDTVKIDGESYELLGPNDLPIAVQMRIARCATRYGTLDDSAIETMSMESWEELGDDLRESARAIIDGVPPEVFDRLTDEQCIAVIQCFSGTPAAKQASKSSRTSKRSPASKRTTAVAPASGAA